MSTPIKTNRLIVHINRDEYEKRYDIFLITTSEKYFRRGTYVMDTPILCDNVLSICFESGKEFYVLMRKNETNKAMLKKVIAGAEDGDALTVSFVKTSQVKNNILVQLLLNSLANYELDFMRFNNLTGHLYCFYPKWVKRSKNGEKYTIMQVPCLELKVLDDMLLVMQVHTFTSELLRNKITFRKKKFEEYPKYIFSANNTLRRRLKDDKTSCFIMRQVDGVKTEIPFLDIQSKDSFDASKTGVLANMMGIFHNKLGDICQIEFATINNYISLERTRKIAKENESSIKRVLESHPIKLVDEIRDEYSSVFCERINNILKEKYSLTATIGTRISKDYLNICVIHNANYYNGLEDPHLINRAGYTVQHITFEDFMDSAEVALSTVIHELIIKNDIANGKISLFDWAKLGLQENIAFGLRVENEEGSRYFFMEIKPDGRFAFSEQTLNLFELNDYSECVNIFEDNSSVCGIIKRANGEINVISNTNWITIPELMGLNNELTAGNTHLRGKNKRDELLSSVLDIKLFDEGTDKFYFVGTIGEGMRTKIVTAANIRKISTYKNSPLMFDELLPLMNVTFVHNGQLTVIPFPFKYLREYIKMIA